MTQDRLLRGIAGDFRVAIAVTTATTAEAVRLHDPSPIGGVALARALTSVALMGITGKEGRRLSAQWMGRGELGSLHADLQAPGSLRAYFTGSGEARSIPDSFGRGGLLSVISQQDDGTFSQSQVALSGRCVDSDMEGYLKDSNQVASMLRVLVDLDDELRPGAVAGVLLQALPGGDKAAVRTMVSEALSNRTLPADLPIDELIRQGIPGLPEVEWMFEAPLIWRCPCSRERIESGIRLLGREELTEMLDLKETTEVRCEFCTALYRFTLQDLAALRDGLA